MINPEYVGMCTAAHQGLIGPDGQVYRLEPGLELVVAPDNYQPDDSPESERTHIIWATGINPKSWVATNGFRFF